MLASTTLLSTAVKRSYLPADFAFSSKEDILPLFEELKAREVNDIGAFKQWLTDRSELEAALQENVGWRYIRMSCDTTNKDYTDAYTFFVTEIQPLIAPLNNDLDTKMLAFPFVDDLNEKGFKNVLRQVRKRVEIFRAENVPLIAELQNKEQEYASITGSMTVEVDGKELTLQQAANFLEVPDQSKREEVYRKILSRRLQDRDKLDNLFNELVKLRHRIALNAGFSNYRDYMFANLGRFDYTGDDCFKFHHAVEKFLVPLVQKNEEMHRANIGVDVLRPWDLNAEPEGQKPLRPYDGSADLINKTIACFNEMDPFLGACIEALKNENRLDLESRKGKAPGGYNYPLYETGMPFIFMNSTNTLRDLVTMVHEGGHAVHSIVDRPLDLVDYKNLPSEVAELASMSMELMSMEYWKHYFTNDDELLRAKKKHLADVLKGLPWIAAVDAFQHWIYLNPDHTAEERRKAWRDTYARFSGKAVNWEGLDDAIENMWQKQLHIFEVPFYYIEYGFAQLGAIAVWRNFILDQKKALEKYISALSLGYTDTIGAIYSEAGISFNFEDSYVAELSGFVSEQLAKLEQN
jgi:oligoendopeptidase F